MRRVIVALVLVRAGMGFALISPSLQEHLSTAQPDQKLPVQVVLNEQFDKTLLDNMVDGLPRPARRVAVAQILQGFSAEKQAEILEYLATAEAQGSAANVQSFWIVNAVYCEATPAVIQALSERPEVNYVNYDLVYMPGLLEPEYPASPEEITWGVQKINAPAVWGQGYTGQGIVCGHIDTGCDYTHPDLADHMWTDPNYPYHGWNFENNNNNPMDVQGHGTHTAGTVASDGTAGTQAGVAPDAQIMVCRVRTIADSVAESQCWQAMQFCVSPPLSPSHGADLYTMSLGWQISWEPHQAVWRQAANNVNAAGLIQCVGAGNERKRNNPPYACRCPGNVPPPWWNPQNTGSGTLSGVVSVGATDRNDNIASFSSPGPVTWSNVPPFNDYVYPPGLTRPDVSAPGVNVKSCAIGGGYTNMDGTSMATPHTAGTVCLMLSKNPNLTPEQVDMMLEMSAVDRGPTGKDNDYGAGRIDALAAVNAIPRPPAIVISDAPEAIGPGQGKHIVRRPGTGQLYIVYQATNGVHLATSNDNGQHWGREFVAQGSKPCISLDYHGSPWIVYVRDNSKLYCSVRRPDGTWAERFIYQDPNDPDAVFSSPSFVCSNWRDDAVPHPPPPDCDMGYLVVHGCFRSGLSSRVLFIAFDTVHINNNGMYNYTVIELNTPSQLPALEPCISHTPGDYIHVTWTGVSQQKWTYYQTARTNPGLIRSGSFPVFTPPWRVSEPYIDVEATQPVNDAYGDYLIALWRARGPTPVASIYERDRELPSGGWSDPAPWSEEQFEAGYPAMSHNAGVWRQEFTSGVGNIVCRFFGENHPTRLTDATADQLYPQTDVQLAPRGGYDILHTIWSQRLPSGVYIICFASFLHLNADRDYFYDIVCGQENPSPYCVHRDGAMAFDSYAIDFADSALVYRLSYLHPLYRYRIHATVYHEGAAPLVEELAFLVDSTTLTPGTVVSAEPGVPIEVWLDVPPQLHRDGVTDLVIRRLSGTYAAVAGIEMHEFEPEDTTEWSGGQSVGRTTPQHPPAILGVLPNPFTRATTIKYQLFDAGSVSLRILDVTGRCVRVIKSAETEFRRSGIYAVTWDGLDSHNRALPSGIYFCQLEADERSVLLTKGAQARATAKVCLIR